MKEIRWHARAGQGSKTASQILAVALLRGGKSVQAFPEYGPERRGAPMRAYTRFDDRPIRRHDSIEHPDVVVVLEPSLLHDAAVTAGLGPDGLIVANTMEELPLVAAGDPDLGPGDAGFAGGASSLQAVCVPAADLGPARSVNLIVLGAVAAALGEPTLDDLLAAALEVLGKKADPEALRTAIAAGYDHVAKEALCLS